MARLLLLFSLCVLPLLVNAHRPFYIRGKVYCDTCRAGFETSVTTYIPGARVRIVCKDRRNLEIKYSTEGVTDSTGTYNIKVKDDHQDQMCYATLVSSPIAGCNVPHPARSRAHVILTRDNGAISDLHYANAMGFLKEKPLSVCAELLQLYLIDGDRSF